MHPSRLLLAALACGLVLGACSDPEPKVADPTPSPTASTSSTAAVTPPPTTPASEPLTPADTVSAWVSDWNMALTSGDTTQLRSYNRPRCRNCDSVLGIIDNVYGAGGRIDGGIWTPVSIKPVEDRGNRVTIALAAEVAGGSTIPSEGADAITYAAEKSIVRFFLVREGDTWKFSAIEILS